MKPIEPGCLAMTYGCYLPENNNQVVTVVRFVGYIPGRHESEGPLWETDCEGRIFNGYVYASDNRVGENNLLRIDGYEPEESDFYTVESYKYQEEKV